MVVPAVGIGAVVGLGLVVPELGAIAVREVGTGLVVGLGVVASELSVVVPALGRGRFFQPSMELLFGSLICTFHTDIHIALHTQLSA